MLDKLPELIFGAHALFYGVGFMLLIFLVFKRIRDKRNEDFEQRDN